MRPDDTSKESHRRQKSSPPRCVGYCGGRETVHQKAAKRCSENDIAQRSRLAGTGPIIRHAEPVGVVCSQFANSEPGH